MILLVVKSELGKYIAGLGVDGEGNVVRREVGDLGVDALISVLGMHSTDQFARSALFYRKFVRQALELRILVIDIRHLDIHSARARQSASILRFDNLKKDA